MSHVRHSSVIFTRNCLRPTLVNIVAFSFFLYNISTSEALLKIPSFPVVFLHAFRSTSEIRNTYNQRPLCSRHVHVWTASLSIFLFQEGKR